MIISLFILSLVMYGVGYATHKHFNLRQHPEPPALDTPEHVLSYLEACSLDQQNYDMHELFSEFRIFINQHQQHLIGESTIIADKPEWFHNPNIDPSCEEHWETFLKDLKREEDPKARIGVVRHWMGDLNNGFTYKEMEMILDYFENGEDRAAVRRIYAGKRKEKKEKKTE